MTETLHIKNTGPIKEVNLKIKKVTIFIGKNGTGKSITGKILQLKRDEIFSNFYKNLKEEYQLQNYITPNSKIDFIPNENLKKASEILKQFTDNFEIKRYLEYSLIENKNLPQKAKENLKTIKEILEKEKEIKFSYYIPTERNMVPFLSSYGINFLTAKIPLPQYILEFASNFRLAKDMFKEIDVFEYKYKFENDEDRIYIDKNNFISLMEASSGIQALLPLKITIPYLNRVRKKDFILEEPELNLFPQEQFELVKFMIENSNSVLFISHSPYILVSLNILLFAYQVGNINYQTKKLVSKFIPQKYWINPDNFSGYCFDDGGVIDIAKNGLISNNYLDDVNDELNNLFDELLEIKVMNEK